MEACLTLTGVSYRHKVRDFSSWKPWAKMDGAGIHSIDLELKKGNILGLIGPNGAGKSTLMRAICGLYDCEGFDKTRSKRRAAIGYMPEQVRWEGRMTQRLSLACALIGNPEILVMDEPLNGLDPLAQRAFCNLLKQLANKGVSIVISSHQVTDLESLVDRAAILHHGQMLIEGSLDHIRESLELADDSGIVEMICAVTGIDPDEVSLELSNDNMLPFKTIRGEEE